MPKQIIAKKCCDCKQIKSIDDFHRNRARKDGHNTVCKPCSTLRQRILNRTDHRKQYMKNYRNSEVGKKKHFECIDRIKQNCPNFTKAHWTIAHAIQAGKLPKINTLQCVNCNQKAQHYHHHMGYSLDYILHVIPVCALCHKLLHKSIIP